MSNKHWNYLASNEPTRVDVDKTIQRSVIYHIKKIIAPSA